MSHGKLEELILNQSNDLIWMVDADLMLTYANKAYLNLMKQVTGKEKKLHEPILVEGFGEGYIEKWSGYYKKALSGYYFEIEEHYSHPETNEIKFGQIIFNPIRDDNNQVVAVACQSRDITRIVQQRSDAHQLMDASLDVFCTINEEGNFVFVNEAATKHWGYTAQELIGKPYMSFVIEDDISKTNDITDAILSGEEIKSFVNRYKRKDGAIAYNLWSARWDSEAKLMYGVARDAKEKIEQENLLLQSEKRFKALVQDGADMISIIGIDGRYSYTSPTTTGILGITPEEFQGQTIFDFIHPDDIERAAEYMQRISTESKVIVEPFRLRDGKNEWRWIETVLTNMLDNPAVNGIVANSRDITEQIKTENLLKESYQLSRIGSWEVDLINNSLFWSDITHEIHETAKNFKPQLSEAINFYREDFRELATKEVNTCIETGAPYDFEAIIVTNKNNEVWVRSIGKAEMVDGKCIRIYGSLQDIHKRKEAEIRLQSLSDNLPGVVYQYIIHPDGTDSMQFISGMVEKMWGYTSNEVMQNVDLLWDQIKQGGYLEEVKSSVAKSIETKSKWTCRFKIINRTGEVRTHFGSGTPIFLADGTILFHVMVLDITQEAKNEELLEEVTNISRIGSWEVDLINNSIFWSDITHEIHETPENYTPQLSESINFYHEDFRELVDEAVSACIETGTPFDFEAIVVTNKNNEVWVRAMGRAEMLDGKCARIYGSFQDINQRKKAQLELLKAKELAEENEQKMKEAQKLAHIGSWYYDFVNQVSQWSEETYNIWGLNPDTTSVDFVDHQKLIHPKDWERFNAVIKDAIEKGIPYKMDLELVRADGSYKTVNTIGDPVFDENNKVIAFKGTTQDISDRIIIENELRSAIKKAEESDARFKVYTQQSPIAIYTTDINGDCIYANETWLEMAGMQLEDALGKGWINALHPEDLEYVTDNWYKSIESNGEWNYEYRFVNSNKNIIWVNGNAKKLFNDKNELIGYLGSNVNITERKKAEQEKNSLLTTLEKSLNEIYVFDAETLKFSYVNQGALKNLGYSEQQIKELTPLDLKPEFTLTTFNQLVKPLITKEKEKIVFFSNHKRKNGTLYPVEIHLQFVVEGNNKRFLAVILDITNLKETEKLLDSASRLARVGSWELVLQDNEEFKMFWSGMTKNIVEIDESFEPTLADGINLHKEPSRTLISAAVNNAIETGEAFDLELELVTVKGNDIWVRCIGDTQFENGKVTRIFGSYQDINTRKLAELNQLKLNEEKSTILESIGDAFYALDGELNFTYMNSSCANVLGVRKEKIIGKNLFEEFPDLKNTQFEDELRKVQHTAKATKFEFYYAPFDSWFDESIYPTPTGISVYFVDITQRKKAEAARIMAEKSYQELFDKSNDAIYVHDIDTGQLIDVNYRATELTGFDKMDLLENDPSFLFTDNPEYTMEKAIEYIQKAAQGNPQVFEWLAKKKDGTSCWFEMTLRRTNIAGVDKILAFQRDITERKESESKLIENENYLRTILNTEPECVKVLNSKGELLSMNPAGLAMIEADNEQQVLGHRMTDLVNKEYQLGFNRLSKEVFNGVSGSFEFEITGLKGGCRWLETHAVPLKDPTGKIVNLLGVTRDITQRKNYENQLLKLNESIQQHAHQLELSNEELEQFAFIASHDLQEPLRMISSFLEQLKRKYNSQLDEKAHQYIHFATDGAKRMKQIILDLLEYSRAGKLADSIEVIDMNEILEQYSFLRQKIITEKTAIINISQLPVIKSYKAPLTQTLHCLLDNAIKYSREDQPPHITISAEELADSWMIRIADNGIGIDPKFFEKIFIIFQRLHNREAFTGSGVGLSIAKKHTESWGGKIWLESEPGKGSIFYFTHPKEIN